MKPGNSSSTLLTVILFVTLFVACGDDDMQPDSSEDLRLVRVERNGEVDSELEYFPDGRIAILKSYYNQNPVPDVTRHFGWDANGELLKTSDFDADGDLWTELEYTAENSQIIGIDQTTYDDMGQVSSQFTREYEYAEECGRSAVYRSEKGVRYQENLYEYTDEFCSYRNLYLSETGDITLIQETQVDDAAKGYVFESIPYLSPYHGNIVRRVRHRNGLEIDSANSYNASLTYDADGYLRESMLLYFDGDTNRMKYFYE